MQIKKIPTYLELRAVYMMVQTCNSDIQEAQENQEYKTFLSYIVNSNQSRLYETLAY